MQLIAGTYFSALANETATLSITATGTNLAFADFAIVGGTCTSPVEGKFSLTVTTVSGHIATGIVMTTFSPTDAATARFEATLTDSNGSIYPLPDILQADNDWSYKVFFIVH